jgi:hypothetical protein
MKRNFEVDQKITSLVNEYYLMIHKKYKSDLDFADLNRSTKRDFWFASKEFTDSF